MRGDYLAASARGSQLPYRQYGLRQPPASLEGFLFPATYELRRGTSAATLVDRQLTAFRDNAEKVKEKAQPLVEKAGGSSGKDSTS